MNITIETAHIERTQLHVIMARAVDDEGYLVNAKLTSAPAMTRPDPEDYPTEYQISQVAGWKRARERATHGTRAEAAQAIAAWLVEVL